MLTVKQAINATASELREGRDVWASIEHTEENYNIFESAFERSVEEFKEIKSLLLSFDDNYEKLKDRMFEITNEMNVFSQILTNFYNNHNKVIHSNSYYLLKALSTSSFMKYKKVVLFDNSATIYFKRFDNKLDYLEIGFLILDGDYFTISLVNNYVELPSRETIINFIGEEEYD